jgi:hypothetical protein
LNLHIVAHSSNEWMCRFDEWSVAFHWIISFIENTLKPATMSQLPARANRSLLAPLVQELWLIKLYHLFLQPTLPGARPASLQPTLVFSSAQIASPTPVRRHLLRTCSSLKINPNN